MPPQFLYFDLGNVLLHFDHELACRQMAEVAGIPTERVREIVFGEHGIMFPFELGHSCRQQFYEAFCEQSGTHPDMTELEHAGSAIFSLNAPMVPIIQSLHAAGHRLGILSNTCESHWRYCSEGRYPILPDPFEVTVLSHRVGIAKPDPANFALAAQMAHVEPQAIFFTDDTPGHIQAAQQAGWDAILFTTPNALIQELKKRNLLATTHE